MTPSPDPRDRPHASVIGSLVEGWSRALRAPWVAAGLLVAMLLVTVPWPTMIAVGPDISRMVIDELLGLGSHVAIVIRLLEYEPAVPGTFNRLLVYVIVWLFLSGGLIDRLARARSVGAAAFFAACGVGFARFLRLAMVGGAIYWALIGFYRRLPQNATVDAAFLVTTVILNLTVTFAAIRMVVEDRHSVLSAIGASLRFIRRRPVRVVSLYVITTGVQVLVAHSWIWFDSRVLTGLMAAAVYGLIDIWTRLAAIAAETAFFQHELAHAHYTAAPPRSWPDSPAIEAIENLTRIARASGTRRGPDSSS